MTQREISGSAVMPRCLRAISIRDMSTSIHVVHVAAVCSDRCMCSPISERMRDSGRPSGATYGPCDSEPPAPGRYGLSECRIGSAAAAGDCVPPCAST